MELTMQPAGPVPAAARPASSTGAAGRIRGRAVYWRRRLVVVLGFLGLVLALTMLFGNAGAEAELEDPVGGHAVVEPGETLWDIAAATAPPGIRTQQQLDAIRELNGLAGADVPAWTVVLLPAS